MQMTTIADFMQNLGSVLPDYAFHSRRWQVFRPSSSSDLVPVVSRNSKFDLRSSIGQSKLSINGLKSVVETSSRDLALKASGSAGIGQATFTIGNVRR
jgi:hypothetical protein